MQRRAGGPWAAALCCAGRRGRACTAAGGVGVAARVHGRGAKRPPSNWDVLIDHESTVTPERMASALEAAVKAIAPRTLKLVHAPAAQFPAALGMYALRGGVLASVAHGGLARARGAAAALALGLRKWTHPSVSAPPESTFPMAWCSSFASKGAVAIS